MIKSATLLSLLTLFILFICVQAQRDVSTDPTLESVLDKSPAEIKRFIRSSSSLLWANEHLEKALEILQNAGEDPTWCEQVRQKAEIRMKREAKKKEKRKEEL